MDGGGEKGKRQTRVHSIGEHVHVQISASIRERTDASGNYYERETTSVISAQLVLSR